MPQTVSFCSNLTGQDDVRSFAPPCSQGTIFICPCLFVIQDMSDRTATRENLIYCQLDTGAKPDFTCTQTACTKDEKGNGLILFRRSYCVHGSCGSEKHRLSIWPDAGIRGQVSLVNIATCSHELMISSENFGHQVLAHSGSGIL